jgi:RNA polymerase sigma-70 factor (ECF subfamily)
MLSGTVTGDARPLDPTTLGDHVDRLFRAAWALCGTREDAEDLVQETFARVLAKPRLLRGDDDLGYLLRVLRNTFVSRHRASERRPRAAMLAEDAEFADPVAGRRPEEAVLAREVFAHIAALPEAFRDALVAVDVAGLSYDEAARLLGVKVATITSRLFRARAQVAAGMDPERAGVLREHE